jgi:hypothetical protein
VSSDPIVQSDSVKHLAFDKSVLIVDVKCLKDSSISYALYIPQKYVTDKENPIIWYSFQRNQQWMNESKSKKDVEILRWFGDPYTIAEKNGDTLNMYAVKFGRTNMKETEMKKTFIFHYKLYQEKEF